MAGHVGLDVEFHRAAAPRGEVQLLLATDRDATPTPVELVVPITVFSTNSTSGGTQ